MTFSLNIHDPCRRQLTLFLTGQRDVIEEIRSRFNPIQFNLIPAHVTLCKEDEIEPLDLVVENITSIAFDNPVRMEFGPVKRVENGKGVLIPGGKDNTSFQTLRKLVLKGVRDDAGEFQPHITLMHPRNATCTDEIFSEISQFDLPPAFTFHTISLIEQVDDGPWTTRKEFRIVREKGG